MKRILCICILSVLLSVLASCGTVDSLLNLDVEPRVSQMRAICELAVMDCYYHNVAKFHEKDASGALWWKKDKHFWIEYGGIVRFGIDASKVIIEVSGDDITITIPPAKVLGCKIDSDSLSQSSFIIDADSAPITAEDEVYAYSEAQRDLEEAAALDTMLLSNAQQRAQELLENYIENIGNAVGKSYHITWIYVDENGHIINPSAYRSQNENDNE